MPQQRYTNADIARQNLALMEQLGKMSAGIDGVHRELDAANQSRAVMHARIDEQNKTIAAIDAKVGAAAVASKEAKDEIDAIRKDLSPMLSLKDDLPAMVQGWKELNTNSKRLMWLMGIGGASIIGAAVWLGDFTTDLVKAWLGLGPNP